MIKNEEQFLRASLESCAQLSNEIILADTGSRDDSLKIAKSFQAKHPNFKIIELKWEHDFSKTRNKIAAQAKNDWVFFIDGDEVVDEKLGSSLKSLIQQSEVDSFSFVQRNYTTNVEYNNLSQYLQKELPPGLPECSEKLFYFDNHMERLYRKSSKIQYEGRIHESLIPSCRRLGLKWEKKNELLHHYGRLKSGHHDKLLNYLDLSRQKWKEERDNPAAWIEVMVTFCELTRFEEAFQLAGLASRMFPKEFEVIKTCYEVALRFQKYPNAEQWIRQCLRLRPDHLDTKAQLTTALLYQKKIEACRIQATQVLNEDPKNFLSHLHLGVIEFENKNWPAAKQHLAKALEQRPYDDFLQNALQRISEMQQLN